MTESRWTKEHFEAVFRELLGEEDDPARARKRARILKAATELFIAQGYRKTSVDEIAKRAEVAKGTVYLYFPNKVTLLSHAVAIEKRALLQLLGPIFSGEIPERERLRFWVGVMLTVGRDLPLVARLLRDDAELKAALDDLSPEDEERAREQGRAMMVELIELAAPGVFTDEEKRLRADVLLSVRFLAGVLMEPRSRGGRGLDELAGAIADMLVYGAIHRPPGRGEG